MHGSAVCTRVCTIVVNSVPVVVIAIRSELHLAHLCCTGSWDETKRKISDELCVASSKGGVVVQYLDDEDDWITVATYNLMHSHIIQ